MIGNLVGLTLDNKEEVRENFLQLQKENSATATR
jgi:hypothetical protein